MIEITAEIRAIIDCAAADLALAEDEFIDLADGIIHCKHFGGNRMESIKRRKAQGLQDRYLYDYTFANDNGQNLSPVWECMTC